MNNAPFKIGQKVEFIDCVIGITLTEKVPPLKKGDIYTVTDIELQKCNLFNEEKDWFILVDGISEYWCRAKDFRPIEEPKEKIRYVAVSESLREKAVEIAAIETN